MTRPVKYLFKTSKVDPFSIPKFYNSPSAEFLISAFRRLELPAQGRHGVPFGEGDRQEEPSRSDVEPDRHELGPDRHDAKA